MYISIEILFILFLSTLLLSYSLFKFKREKFNNFSWFFFRSYLVLFHWSFLEILVNRDINKITINRFKFATYVFLLFISLLFRFFLYGEHENINKNSKPELVYVYKDTQDLIRHNELDQSAGSENIIYKTDIYSKYFTYLLDLKKFDSILLAAIISFSLFNIVNMIFGEAVNNVNVQASELTRYIERLECENQKYVFFREYLNQNIRPIHWATNDHLFDSYIKNIVNGSIKDRSNIEGFSELFMKQYYIKLLDYCEKSQLNELFSITPLNSYYIYPQNSNGIDIDFIEKQKQFNKNGRLIDRVFTLPTSFDSMVNYEDDKIIMVENLSIYNLLLKVIRVVDFLTLQSYIKSLETENVDLKKGISESDKKLLTLLFKNLIKLQELNKFQIINFISFLENHSEKTGCSISFASNLEFETIMGNDFIDTDNYFLIPIKPEKPPFVSRIKVKSTGEFSSYKLSEDSNYISKYVKVRNFYWDKIIVSKEIVKNYNKDASYDRTRINIIPFKWFMILLKMYQKVLEKGDSNF